MCCNEKSNKQCLYERTHICQETVKADGLEHCANTVEQFDLLSNLHLRCLIKFNHPDYAVLKMPRFALCLIDCTQRLHLDSALSPDHYESLAVFTGLTWDTLILIRAEAECYCSRCPSRRRRRLGILINYLITHISSCCESIKLGAECHIVLCGFGMINLAQSAPPCLSRNTEELKRTGPEPRVVLMWRRRMQYNDFIHLRDSFASRLQK